MRSDIDRGAVAAQLHAAMAFTSEDDPVEALQPLLAMRHQLAAAPWAAAEPAAGVSAPSPLPSAPQLPPTCAPAAVAPADCSVLFVARLTRLMRICQPRAVLLLVVLSLLEAYVVSLIGTVSSVSAWQAMRGGLPSGIRICS